MSEQDNWITDEWIAEQAATPHPGHDFPEWAQITVTALAVEIQSLRRALAEQEARHKRAKSLLESLQKHWELTAPASGTYSTTYQIVLAALAALEEKP